MIILFGLSKEPANHTPSSRRRIASSISVGIVIVVIAADVDKRDAGVTTRVD